MAGRTRSGGSPERTCVGCRLRAATPDLLRLAVIEVDGIAAVVPDLRGRLPGRGASLHPDQNCLDLAERRRALPRAFRRTGSLDTSALRRHIEAADRNTVHPPDEQ